MSSMETIALVMKSNTDGGLSTLDKHQMNGSNQLKLSDFCFVRQKPSG